MSRWSDVEQVKDGDGDWLGGDYGYKGLQIVVFDIERKMMSVNS